MDKPIYSSLLHALVLQGHNQGVLWITLLYIFLIYHQQEILLLLN